MADTDKKRKESDDEPPSSSTETKRKKETNSTIDAVRSWMGSSSSSALETKDNDDDDEGNNGNTAVLRALKELRDETKTLRAFTEQQVKVSREADKMRRIEFALQRLDEAAVTREGTTSGLNPLTAMEGSYLRALDGHCLRVYRYEVTDIGMWGARSLLRNMLWSFRAGAGHCLRKREYFSVPDWRKHMDEIQEEWYENFQKALIDELHKLLGKEPRCENNSDGETMTLHYE